MFLEISKLLFVRFTRGKTSDKPVASYLADRMSLVAQRLSLHMVFTASYRAQPVAPVSVSQWVTKLTGVMAYTQPASGRQGKLLAPLLSSGSLSSISYLP